MDKTEQSAAAAASPKPDSYPAADPAAGLDAYLHRAMRLEDPSSPSNKQQHGPAATSPPPQPPQVPVPILRANVLEQLQAVRQYWPQPQPQLQRYGAEVGESSMGAGYASPLGASNPRSFYASHYGAYSPRFTEPLPPFTSSKLSASAEHYDPTAPPHPSEAQPSSTAASSSASHFQPSPSAPPLVSAFAANGHNASPNPHASAFAANGHNASPNPHASAPATALNLNAYAGLNNPYAAAPSTSRHGNAGMVRYAAALQSRLHADAAGYQPWIPMAPAARSPPTLEWVRSRLLRGPPDTELVMSQETAGHVVRLLREGRDEVRLGVLATVKRAVHSIMGSSEGHAVFLALLSACGARPGELQGVVQAVCNGTGFLTHVAKYDHGVTCLKRLIMVVAPYHELCQSLIVWLLGESLMDHCQGAQLLRHCFITMTYENCSFIIRFAIFNLNEALRSASGSRSLAECFENATGDELRVLEQIVLNRTSEIAKGQYSNYFLQRVLECGSEELKAGVVERVAADVVSLAADQFGSYVVEACFLRAGSPAPLQRVLAAVLALRGDQLAEMVQGRYSNYVVHKLLATGKDRSPKQTMALARRIERLPASVQTEMHAQQVMRVVKKLFPKQPR